MLYLKDLQELYKFVEKSNYPIAWIIPIILIIFLIWRKFTTTEYVTAGRAAFESLNKLCDQLQEENEILHTEFKEIKEQFDECMEINRTVKEEIEKLKIRLQN